MIIEKLLDEDNLTENEKNIANYLLDKNNQIENLTSKELGARTFTSQAAVMRLWKKVGVKTYREFLSIIIIERNEYFKIDNVEHENFSDLFSSVKDIQSTISKLYAKSIIATNLLLEENTIIRICNRLMSAYRVDIYGMGISETIAKQMVFKLQSIGINASLHDGLNYHHIQNMKNKNMNVSILVTIGVIDKTIIDILDILNKQNIYTVLIMGENDKELIHLCNDYLIFDTSAYKEIDVMCASFAAEYIINLIYSVLIARKSLSDKNIQKID